MHMSRIKSFVLACLKIDENEEEIFIDRSSMVHSHVAKVIMGIVIPDHFTVRFTAHVLGTTLFS